MKQNSTDYPDLTDEELMAMVSDRDSAAFEELATRYGGLIFHTAHRVLGVTHDAEDLRQQVLLSLWDKASSWDAQKGRLSTWISTLTRNRAIDLTRSWKSRSDLMARYRDEKEVPAPRQDCPTIKRIAIEESHRLAREALGRLRPEDRQLLTEVYFHDLTHAEVARRSGMPLGTVKARVSRALKQLRRVVSSYRFAELAPAAA